MKVWLIMRLLLATACFAASLLVVFQAPTIPLFRLHVAVTEFGHWLFLAPLALALTAPHRSWPAFSGTALALTSCGLLLSSAVRAQIFAASLPEEMAHAFPGFRDASAQAPFRWSSLWVHSAIVPGPVETYEYATHDGVPLHYRFYRAVGRNPAPCVIVLHGGGWENGTPDEFVDYNHRLAHLGYAVAALEYRFAPRWPWPAQRDDVMDALQCLKDHSVALGIDPQRFVLLGRSAGGQIAEASSYAAHDPAIRGCISFYAPADLYLAYQFGRDDDILSSLSIVRGFMGGTPEVVPGNYDSASAIRLANRESPPTLLLHGRKDELVWYLQSQRFSAHLKEVGAPHAFIDLPWATHAFDYNLHGPGGQISCYAVESFLATVTR